MRFGRAASFAIREMALRVVSHFSTTSGFNSPAAYRAYPRHRAHVVYKGIQLDNVLHDMTQKTRRRTA